MDGFDSRFSIPSNMLMVGPTSSGKTTWLKHLVLGRHEYFAALPETMLLFYKEPQKTYENSEDDMNRDKRSNSRFPSFRKFKGIRKKMSNVQIKMYRESCRWMLFVDFYDFKQRQKQTDH